MGIFCEVLKVSSLLNVRYTIARKITPCTVYTKTMELAVENFLQILISQLTVLYTMTMQITFENLYRLTSCLAVWEVLVIAEGGCVAVCCSVLQCVAVCCSVLQ